MRDILHAFAMVAVIAVAALCTLVQLSDANHAFDRLGHDEQAVIQQVSSDSHRGHGSNGGGNSGGPSGGRQLGHAQQQDGGARG